MRPITRPLLAAPVVASFIIVSISAGLKAQVVTFNTALNTTAALSIAATFNATQQASGVSGTPSLSRTTLTNTTGAAGSFFSNGANITNTLNLATNYVGFSVTPSAGNVILATGINWTSQGSGTAPNSYATAYSTDGFTTSTQTTFTGTTATSTQTRNFDIGDLITNDALTVRLYNYGATSISNAVSATGGSFRVITPTVTGSTVSTAAGAIVLAANTEIRNSGALSLGGDISGAFAITKNGAGNLTLSGNNSYSGGTTLNAGTTTVGHLSALGSNSVTLSAGATLNLGGFAVANTITNNGGTLSGVAGTTAVTQSGGTVSGSVGGIITTSGTIAGTPTFTGTLKGTASFTGAVVIPNGGTLSPGNSPGTLTFAGGLTLGGGNYVWEVNDANGAAGTNYDTSVVTGGLTLTATPLNKLNIVVTSLTILNNSGVVIDFTNGSPGHTWTLVSTTTGITGFDPAAVNIDLTNFANTNFGSAYWKTEVAGNNFNLVYVPEPSTYAALAGLAVLGLALRRRRSHT